MSLKILESENFENLFLESMPFIDVRAPVEFAQGSLPNAINLPILNDEERAKVGTLFKEKGPVAATELGHQLVFGEIKQKRLNDWTSFIQKNPRCILYCFRGGQRSQITQAWLQEQGVSIVRLGGGYKLARQFLIDKIEQISETRNFLPLAGPTGSGKTILINELKNLYPTIDLEALARHRGSAFGAWDVAQPAQIDFENQLSVAMMRIDRKFKSEILPLVEDESRLIGRNVVPKQLFEKISSSPVVLLDEKIEVRVQNIFQDYILNSAIGKTDEEKALEIFAKYKKSLQAISKKLGGERTKEILELLQFSEDEFRATAANDSNRAWIEKLLLYYYDPLYLSSLSRRNVRVLFKGQRAECFSYVKDSL